MQTMLFENRNEQMSYTHTERVNINLLETY